MAVAGAEAAAAPAPRRHSMRSRELLRDHDLVPLRETLIDDCETPVSAFLKLRERRAVLPAGVRRPGPRRALLVHRLPPADGAALVARRPGRPVPARAAELGRFRAAPLPGLPPFAGGAVGMFAYDLVRTVEPLGEPNPDALGMPDLALMLTDALVAFDHLERTVTVIANVYADDDARGLLRPGARRRSPRCGGGWPDPCPARLGGPRQAPASAPEVVRLQHVARALRGDGRADHRVHLRRRRLPGGALPALVGAGPGAAPSRSTAGCAPSTRARTCTSWTSATSRSPAPAPSR